MSHSSRSVLSEPFMDASAISASDLRFSLFRLSFGPFCKDSLDVFVIFPSLIGDTFSKMGSGMSLDTGEFSKTSTGALKSSGANIKNNSSHRLM